MKILIVYRCCENETIQSSIKTFRPQWFNKIIGLDSILNEIQRDVDVKFIAIHDGPPGVLYQYLLDKSVEIQKINECSNEKSLKYCLDFAKSKYKDHDVLYFVEDDFLHRKGWLPVLKEGVAAFKLVTLYDHLDRYIRTDDIKLDLKIQITKESHWRIAESTTCTWAVSTDIFMAVYDEAIRFLLNDRAMFRHFHNIKIPLWTCIPGYSTHVVATLYSPCINWEQINKEVNV